MGKIAVFYLKANRLGYNFVGRISLVNPVLKRIGVWLMY
jgi:hypothetical protein